MTDKKAPTKVELYVRSLAPSGCVESQMETIQRLERLQERGDIDEFDIQVVGRGIVHDTCCALTPTGKLLLDRMAVIDKWAQVNDADVPGISTRTVTESPVRDRAYTLTTVPQCLLLEYHEDKLQRLSPSTIGEDHYSVEDHLDSLEGIKRFRSETKAIEQPASDDTQLQDEPTTDTDRLAVPIGDDSS